MSFNKNDSVFRNHNSVHFIQLLLSVLAYHCICHKAKFFRENHFTGFLIRTKNAIK